MANAMLAEFSAVRGDLAAARALAGDSERALIAGIRLLLRDEPTSRVANMYESGGDLFASKRYGSPNPARAIEWYRAYVNVFLPAHQAFQRKHRLPPDRLVTETTARIQTKLLELAPAAAASDAPLPDPPGRPPPSPSRDFDLGGDLGSL